MMKPPKVYFASSLCFLLEYALSQAPVAQSDRAPDS